MINGIVLDIIAHTGPDELKDCLKNADVVIVAAAAPHKPGIAVQLIDLFSILLIVS